MALWGSFDRTNSEMNEKQRILARREYPIVPKNILRSLNSFNQGVTDGTTRIKISNPSKCHDRWRYSKSHGKYPRHHADVFNNTHLLDALQRACVVDRNVDISFDIAMSEADRQILNPRCDSANQLDKLAYFYMNCGDVSKAIKCFEYSFIMRKQIYGTHSKYDEIVQSLMQLGAAYCKNNQHEKALTASGLSLEIARIMKCSELEAITWHNAGHCREKLKEYHAALNCHESREAALRKKC
ncbi:uncharacterized protein LOC100180403 [Ciona intestinalis]